MKTFLTTFLLLVFYINSFAQEDLKKEVVYSKDPGWGYRTAGFVLLGTGVTTAVLGIIRYPENSFKIVFNDKTDAEEHKYAKKYFIASGILSAGSIISFIIAAETKRNAKLKVTNQKTDLGRLTGRQSNLTGISLSLPLGR